LGCHNLCGPVLQYASYVIHRTASLKLLVTSEQSKALAALALDFSGACNAIVPAVVEHRCWNRVALHHLVYYSVRKQFPALGSQMVCQAIHRVADAYRTLTASRGIDKDKPVPVIAFRPTSVNFDKRTYSIKSGGISLFTLGGRKIVPFVGGKHQLGLFAKGLPKEARLVIRKGMWYFNLVLDLPDAPPVGGGVFGVDVGENNLGATSTGKVFGGARLRHQRDQYLAHRRRLQANGSRAARRKLRTVSGREQRHVKAVNHAISKAIVAEAVRAGAGQIRMEDLTHIRANIKAGKRVRTRLHRWAFRQLQDFVAYKAQGAGLAVMYINPAYTSQTCSVCGAIGKRVRHRFSCLCGNQRHSDALGRQCAAVNIADFAQPIGSARGVVNRPEFAHRVRLGVVESFGL
jgi:putative transposase